MIYESQFSFLRLYFLLISLLFPYFFLFIFHTYSNNTLVSKSLIIWLHCFAPLLWSIDAVEPCLFAARINIYTFLNLMLFVAQVPLPWTSSNFMWKT